jgi:hypothetical protein
MIVADHDLGRERSVEVALSMDDAMAMTPSFGQSFFELAALTAGLGKPVPRGEFVDRYADAFSLATRLRREQPRRAKTDAFAKKNPSPSSK